MKYFERNHSYKFELAGNYSRSVTFLEYGFECSATFVSSKYGFIIIKKHYAWDGSSIPFKRFLEKITFGKYDGDRYCKKASLVHDAFYQLMRLKKLSRDHKEAIDRLYEKMIIEGATKIITAEWVKQEKIIRAKPWSSEKARRKLISLDKKKDRKLASLPAWAARRYWAVKTFGARTLKPRYRPEKIILET